MDSILKDLRYGLKKLLKSPGFTFIAILALALGIGANTFIFSVVNAVLLRPLPFQHSERLTSVLNKGQGGVVFSSHSFPNFEDIRDQNHVFDQVSALYMTTQFLRVGDEPERLRGAFVSAELFPMLGINPLLGRTFTAAEERSDQGFVVLSYDLWKQRFNGDPQIINQVLNLNSKPKTVLGVMPKGFKYPVSQRQVDFWMPLISSISPPGRQARGAVYMAIFGKLKADATLAQAQADLNTITARLAAQYPAADTGFEVALVSSQERLVGQIRPALLVLLGAVALVLLIACANVANLLLARASARHKEIAIRAAIGATRGRVIRQLLTESLLLSIIGGLAGVLLAVWAIDLLVSANPSNLPRIAEIGLDKRVLLFSLGLTTLTGLFFGLAPALHASRTDLNTTLKDGMRESSGGIRNNRTRSALVISEIALSLILLVGATLLFQSLRRLLEVPAGFDAANVMTADVAVSVKKYPEDAQRSAFYHQALERIAAVPNVQSAAVISPLPLGGSFEAYTFDIAGRPPFPPGQQPSSDSRVISADYFRTMSIPVKQGRAFTDQDREKTTPVVIINETFARLYFPGQEAVGQRIIPMDQAKPITREIVGVVGDVRHAGLDADSGAEYYIPYQQASVDNLTIVARSSAGNPSSLGPSLREVIRSIDKDQPIFNLRTMTQLLDESIAQRRFNLTLLGGFSLLALVLASIGIYGVMSYSVAQRTREIGVRIALGAQARDVLRMILGQGLILTLIGLGLGLAGAFALTRFLATLLFGVTATNPWAYTVVSLVLGAVALVACLIPARRATKVDPLIALRYE
ncbi:MAG TPA: ABC transporter permease [Pyrinomonadaceae bacterium]|jgi:putative ABC transport system permease protein|nr:ABC transporter permease [Pyrinomonadaceae bacterium]